MIVAGTRACFRASENWAGMGGAGVGWPARWVMRRQPAWIERGRSSKLFVGNAYTVRKYLIINLY
jgi:hypothetical protein